MNVVFTFVVKVTYGIWSTLFSMNFNLAIAFTMWMLPAVGKPTKSSSSSQ